MKRIYIALMLSLIAITALIVTTSSFANAVTGNRQTLSKPLPLARISDEVSVQAKGRGNPYISLSDGHDLLTAYVGDERLVEALEQNQVQPLSLASADFDEDGVPDLIAGYEAADGQGVIALHRGNVDAIYPHSIEAQERQAKGMYADAPFLSPARVFSAPAGVDSIGAGDFDGDGHWDIVPAKRNHNRLYLLSGDGRGGLTISRIITLQGDVTAMVVGEMNRRDGLDDIVVGIKGEEGAKVLVFEGPEGALRAQPEEFILPAEATSLALGQLDDKYEYDLAIAAGNELVIVNGRDRKLSLDAEQQATVKAAKVNTQRFSSAITSIVIGDFKEGSMQEIALLCADGKLRVLSREEQSVMKLALERKEIKIALPKPIEPPPVNQFGISERRKFNEQHPATPEREETEPQEPHWQEEVLKEGFWSVEARLVNVRTSSVPLDNVLVMDRERQQIDIAVARMSEESIALASKDGVRKYPNETVEARMETGGQGVAAVLPMRLNSDALSDLVMIKASGSVITVAATIPQATYSVINTNDSGAGSLRQAIVNANINPDLDTITFSIPGSGVKTITLFSPLPQITAPVVIDGYTQPGSTQNTLSDGDNAVLRIELDGSRIAVSVKGLDILAGNSVVQGLVVNRFSDVGVFFQGNGNNRLEGSFIGTNADGTQDFGNKNYGVGIFFGSSGNTIGGSLPAVRNIISGNDNLGIWIDRDNLPQNPTTNNIVRGNYIGSNKSGTGALSNGRGMLVLGANNNFIGGTGSADKT